MTRRHSFGFEQATKYVADKLSIVGKVSTETGPLLARDFCESADIQYFGILFHLRSLCVLLALF